jgi:hypothetical protein
MDGIEARNGHAMCFKCFYTKRMLACPSQWACCLLASTLHQIPVLDAVDDVPSGNRAFLPRVHAGYLELLRHKR